MGIRMMGFGEAMSGKAIAIGENQPRPAGEPPPQPVGQPQTREEKKAAKRAARAARDFWQSPQGQARAAYARGDQVFQTTIDLAEQAHHIVPMGGAFTTQYQHSADAVNAHLNAIAHEGWELLSSSVTFVQHGEKSRDKFMSSGQNVAVSGTTVGVYVFRRSG